MLTDEAKITIEAGHGGAGKVSFFKKGRGPDGGNGGKGGDVYWEATSDLTALNHFAGKTYFKADDGQNGGSNQKGGRAALDLVMRIPEGTEITDLESGEVFNIVRGTKMVICQGGVGGKGNHDLRSSRNTTPMEAQSGRAGQRRVLELKLKLIADFGLIGIPSAGKSSLLNALTAAQVKVGAYPFTTLEPNLGEFEGKIIADIPGLIEGASLGKGLGIKFLKHIEKVPVILHCVAADAEDPILDYKTVRSELEKFNPELLVKREIILLTKTDLCSKEELKLKIKALGKLKKEVLPVSVYDEESLKKLKSTLLNS